MPERPNARSRPRPDTSRRRARFVALTLLVWMLIIGGRLVYLQIYSHELLAKRARRKFVWLAREVEPELAGRALALNLPGVHTIKEPKRYYPNGALAAHVLGFVGLDDKGLGGVEGFYDASL